MVDITTTITIRRPLQEVAVYAANPDYAPEWYENIKSVEWKTDRPLQVGTRLAFIAHFLGRKLAYEYQVVTYRPGEILVMQTSQGPFPMQTTYQWNAIDSNNTSMLLRNTGRPSGFSGLFAPFMSIAMRMANQKDLKRLKSLLEQH
jgi:uncharacterized membrane protein